MNRSEKAGGSRPQSRVQSAFSRSLQRFQELYRRVRGKRKVQETTTPTPPTATLTMPASTTSSPSTAAPCSSTRTPSMPAPSRSPPIPVTPPPEHHTLSCSLRELYTGSFRRLPHTRTTLHPDGTRTTTSHHFKVRILSGWKHGTTVTFHNRASNILHPSHPPSDVVYTIEERPHEIFTREGDDLIMRKKVTLVEALTGCAFLVRTLDGRRLSVDVGCVIPAGFEIGIVGEGMPVVGGLGRKGRLRIKFEVEFPKELSGVQKEGLKSLLVETDGSATTTGEI